jgi:hypothetical protein
MSGSIVNLIIQLVAGAAGGNLAGSLLKQYNLGTLGNSIAGIVGGGASGGGMDIGSVAQVAGGGVGGGILLVLVGLVRQMLGGGRRRPPPGRVCWSGFQDRAAWPPPGRVVSGRSPSPRLDRVGWGR